MPDEKFKLPQSSYEELTKIVKAYGHFEEPVELTEVSRFISLHPTVISRNAGFLAAVGILQSGAKKSPTPSGRELAHALEHTMPDEIQRWWRKIVDDNEFLSKVVAAIRIRNGMDQQTLEAHVAYSAGQPKRPQFMTGARTVIDILKAADVIRESEGKYVSDAPTVAVEPVGLSAVGTAAGVATVVGRAVGVSVPGIRERQPRITVAPRREVATQQININVNITCTPADLDGLGEKLREVIRQLQKESDDEGGQAE